MANRTMAQKERKRKNWVYKRAPKRYGATRVKVSQGPDMRIGEYYARTRSLKDDTFHDNPPRTPEPTIKVDDPVLQAEIKKIWQQKEGRLQKIHEYYNLYIPGQERYGIRYYFGGGEHFFIQELPTLGIRRVSETYYSKASAMIYYDLKKIKWVETQTIRKT